MVSGILNICLFMGKTAERLPHNFYCFFEFRVVFLKWSENVYDIVRRDNRRLSKGISTSYDEDRGEVERGSPGYSQGK